ncbi:MAG TPA: GNAT family N-acetyltransferase [Anaerolineae bacterium]|nr:GNAT family N-acetyltransferase [Anaerolineae bacterium]
MLKITIHKKDASDLEWTNSLISERCCAEFVAIHRQVFKPSNLPGFIALHENERVGLITYSIQGEECEIISMDSLKPGLGIGAYLLNKVKDSAKSADCKRLWLITTNDNLSALHFYHKFGFELMAVHRNAVKGDRELKPQIPMIGEHGIPIRDEIELEFIHKEVMQE